MIAPTFVPELKIAVASARSRFGNQSATALIAAGKLPPSLTPEERARGEEAGHRPDERVRRRPPRSTS